MNVWIIIGLVIAAAVLLCFLLAVANFSYDKFMERYKQMDNTEANTSMTPVEFANRVIAKYIKRRLEIVQISRQAGDAYGGGKLYLSSNSIYKKSLASYTIIAHELGHALQDVSGNMLKVLHALRRTGRVLGVLMLPSLIAGLVLLLFGETLFIVGCGLIGLSVLIFIMALIVRLRQISIEKDASKKAMMFLEDYFDERELKLCRKLLSDAKLTYWAGFLRLILIWTGVSRKESLFN